MNYPKLRNAFRPFYNLNETAQKNLKKWASDAPKSYVAHLALGIYLKRQGGDARGTKYIHETPKENLDRMNDFYKQSAFELRRSLELTAKPYLSIFHLLEIEMQNGNASACASLLKKGNTVLPNNALVRNRYSISLQPRWGGSYQKVEQFIEETKREKVPKTVIFQLEALKENDLGSTLNERGQTDVAMEHFKKALNFSEKVGGTFAIDFLQAARYYACRANESLSSCQ